MVAQGSLEPLVLVRIQAGQPCPMSRLAALGTTRPDGLAVGPEQAKRVEGLVACRRSRAKSMGGRLNRSNEAGEEVKDDASNVPRFAASIGPWLKKLCLKRHDRSPLTRRRAWPSFLHVVFTDALEPCVESSPTMASDQALRWLTIQCAISIFAPLGGRARAG